MLFAMIGRLTRDSLESFIETPIDRGGPASKLVEAAGGTMLNMWQTAEGYVLVIFDAPNVQSVSAMSLSVQAIGRLEEVRLHRLQSTAEFADSVRLAERATEVNQLPA